MKIFLRRTLHIGLFLLVLLAGCAPPPQPPPLTTAVPYQVETGQSLLHRFAPTFWIEENAADYNRIGGVRALTTEKVTIDPDQPVIYAEQREFTTAGGTYTNLIYRVHFAAVPGGLSPYYLGAGKNVGLLILVTLDARQQPLLVTSVHTCGCYLAFFATSTLPDRMRPTDWKAGRQIVYGENLPRLLDYAGRSPSAQRLQIRIRPGTHRVMDVWLATDDQLPANVQSAALQPLDSLQRLPLASGGTTSFYETEGSRAGHVKGSYKTRERLFMSWWALAWKIGQDKYLGRDTTDGPVFYTSLKPWARKASDMRDFAGFLHYWGWDL